MFKILNFRVTDSCDRYVPDLRLINTNKYITNLR
nr:MAG TPA: hypothetical protein [Caudoviricetes sp.]